MAVTSTTLSGVNVWQFSGVVTDAEIRNAWSATISNGVYIINRAIYLTNTCDLTGVQGGFLVDFGTQVLPGVILHTTRDKTKTFFKNFTFFMRTGLSVPNRSGFVKSFDGTSIIGLQTNDGMQFRGGGFIYAVAGNPGGGDPRYLLELGVGDAEGASFFSQSYTEQEPNFTVNNSKIFKGINLHRVIGFPQSGEVQQHDMSCTDQLLIQCIQHSFLFVFLKTPALVIYHPILQEIHPTLQLT